MSVGLTPVQTSALRTSVSGEVNLQPLLIGDESFLVLRVHPSTEMLSVGIVGDNGERAYTTDVHTVR
jgi:hypothetical protein